MPPLTIEDFQLFLAAYNNGNEQAHRSLAELTGCDFGRDFDAWIAWFEANGARSREDWSLDCLEDHDIKLRGLPWEKFIPGLVEALMYPALIVRMHAYHLLRHFTGRGIAFSHRARTSTREKQQERWRNWWRRRGGRFIRKMEKRGITPPAPCEVPGPRPPVQSDPMVKWDTGPARSGAVDLAKYLDADSSAAMGRFVWTLRLTCLGLCVFIPILSWAFPENRITHPVGLMAGLVMVWIIWFTLERGLSREGYFKYLFWGIFLTGLLLLLMAIFAVRRGDPAGRP